MFPQAVNYYKDRGEAVGKQKLFDEIHRNGVPQLHQEDMDAVDLGGLTRMDDNEDIEETERGESVSTQVVGVCGGPLTVNQCKIIQNLVDKHISALTEYAKQWNKPLEPFLRTTNCMITTRNY